jgi:hypothetical protein
MTSKSIVYSYHSVACNQIHILIQLPPNPPNRLAVRYLKVTVRYLHIEAIRTTERAKNGRTH